LRNGHHIRLFCIQKAQRLVPLNELGQVGDPLGQKSEGMICDHVQPQSDGKSCSEGAVADQPCPDLPRVAYPAQGMAEHVIQAHFTPKSGLMEHQCIPLSDANGLEAER